MIRTGSYFYRVVCIQMCLATRTTAAEIAREFLLLQFCAVIKMNIMIVFPGP
jgi:hypothetical protein